jgi:hypothetical protein
MSDDKKNFAKKKFAGLPANKKASHVGVILSFVIFVTFLVFLFSIFGSPIKFSKSKEPLLDYLETELENRLISNLTVVTISPSVPVDKNCIEINNRGLKLPDFNAIVKDKDNNIVNSKVSGDYLSFNKNEDNFFKIYYAQELSLVQEDVPTDCYPITKINSYREDYYLNEDKILKLISDYNSNYTKLKQELGLPINNEFSIGFTDEEGNLTQAGQKEISTDIYSRDIPVQFFDESAKINSGFINIRVW